MQKGFLKPTSLGRINVGVCYTRGTRSRRWCEWWGRRPPPRPPSSLDQTQAPTSVKTPPSPHRLFDLQYSHDELMNSFHGCQILSPSETGFIGSAHRLPNITLLTLIATL